MYAYCEGGGGNCRVSRGVGMLDFESDVSWWNGVLRWGLWTWFACVILGVISLLPVDKHHEAWGEGAVFLGASGSRCT